MSVFKDFFGGENPFHDLFPKLDEHGVVPVLEPRTRKLQDDNVVEDLWVTLEEAYNGCMKKMRIRRQVGFLQTKIDFESGCVCGVVDSDMRVLF